MEFLKTLKQQRIPCSAIAFSANASLDEVLQISESQTVPAKFVRAYRQHLAKQIS